MHAACTPRSSASPGPQPAPHRVPCLRPSAGREGLQPAAELGHLPRHGHALHVSSALIPARPARRPPIRSRAFSPARCVHRDRAPVYTREPRAHALLLRLGRTHPPCPPPTSCASAARGRTPPPSPPLAMIKMAGMTRAGRREAAKHHPEALTEVCVRPRQRNSPYSDTDPTGRRGRRVL